MKAFMSLPIIALGLLLLFGTDISDWVKLKRLQYEAHEKATTFNPANCTIYNGLVYDKHGRKQ